MKYYYNYETNSFAIATNFDFKETPQGYAEITQEQYEELTKQNETDNKELLGI